MWERGRLREFGKRSILRECERKVDSDRECEREVDSGRECERKVD
jgi:hypothetical protein